MVVGPFQWPVRCIGTHCPETCVTRHILLLFLDDHYKNISFLRVLVCTPCIRGICDDALYKLMFYLLTYLLTYLRYPIRVSRTFCAHCSSPWNLWLRRGLTRGSTVVVQNVAASCRRELKQHCACDVTNVVDSTSDDAMRLLAMRHSLSRIKQLVVYYIAL